jgi:uncharacterized protein
MLFVAICTDRPDGQDIRLANRVAHLDYLRLNTQYIKTCGPFIDDDGNSMNGSMLIVEAEDRKAAEAVLSRDPYREAGLFSSVDVRPWRWVIGSPTN